MSDIKVKEEKFVLENETFEMLKALYEFKAVYPKTISFDEGEMFILHQTSARQRNWWQVVNEQGNIGFVPSNYVEKLKVEPAFLLEFLETTIENLKHSDEKEINNIISREQLISNLLEKKSNLEKIMSGQIDDMPEEPTPKEKRHKSKVGNGSVKHASDDFPIEQEPQPKEGKSKHKNSKHEMNKKAMSSSVVAEIKPPTQLIQESPSMNVLTSKLEDLSVTSPSNPDTSLVSEISSGGTTTTTITITSTTDDATIITKDFEDDDDDDAAAGPPAPEHSSKVEKVENSHQSSSIIQPPKHHAVIVEEQDVYQIVESIRKSTNLSHELSQLALRVVISEMEALLPDSGKFLEPIAVHLSTPLTVPDNLLGETHDAQRLRNLFAELADAKNDSEQRSWMLYEDETDITNYLTELIRILVDADTKICRYEMSCDAYNSVNNLVLYYQMESRWNIRKLLLRAFKAMCLLDLTCVDILISSVLPLELVQDMLSNPDNLEKLSELSVMLIMIFSAGHKMPTANFEHMQINFVLFMLNLIENPLEDDQTEFLSDVMINLLLAFNLQFDNFHDNTILEAMQQVKASKSFTEKILLLINREEDPVFVLKHTKPPVNSVLKMLVDLFSIPETTTLFYTNDIKVLIDILVRQLSDLGPGDILRKWYLELCRRILRNTDYAEHQHRALDLMKIFTRIFCEETVESAGDQQIVREISNEFPHIFKA
ncbi:CLUMA_CG009977, isoform A [Clunio marinus]|uniref:CLUMA_CG009977, isoform A n=1 Tax=Clunio marinus TaxID=568069 RepID=A0A1J1I971_9DIPT|nr:CLUMA_CG009977, isoform A [Clunio marinus]